MNIKKFILQDENDEQKLYNILTIINNEKNNSLYLVYTEEEISNELLFAKINIDSEEVFLENITDKEEIMEIEKKINERIMNNGSRY